MHFLLKLFEHRRKAQKFGLREVPRERSVPSLKAFPQPVKTKLGSINRVIET